MTKRFGFTLAEVLVTLTIIGVVASMTVPTLMNSTSTQEYSAGYKKMMSTLNQAITMQYALDGTDMRTYTDFTEANLFKEDKNGPAGMLMNRLQVVQTTDDLAKTWMKGTQQLDNNNAALYLSDGMIIQFPKEWKACPSDVKDRIESEADLGTAGDDQCLYQIMVDVNGDKGKCFWSDQKATGADQKGKNKKLNPGDCFPVLVYPDGVKPADWVGRQIMFNGK